METLLQQFIKAFGWSILNSLWQSAIIYGILFIVMLSIPKLAAKHKHNLAFGAIILMFIGFGYNFIHQLTLNVNNQAPAINAQNIQVYQYFNNLPPSFSSKAEQYFPIVVVFYIIGILLQLFVIVKGYGQLSKLKKESLSAIPDSWKAIFEQVTAHLKINKVIQFHLSSIVNVPLVIGYLKPVVLFPLTLVNQLDNDQVEAILIHELSHIRRNDFLLNLIKTAIETLLFYNPFVWMAGRFIHIEREHACDDLVLKITGKPLNYAHALLKLELLKDKNSPAYALAATGKTQNLYQRIKRITNMKTNYLNAKQQMAALTLGIACLFSIAWINPTEKKKENKKTPKIEVLSVINHHDVKTIVCTDTTKKRKIKIVTIDADGKKTEYNSVKEMPDSLRKDFYRDELFAGKNIYRLRSDSNFKFKFSDSLLLAKIHKEYNSPEAQAKWKKFGEDVAKQYNSPEAQAKWKKFGEDIAKQYNTPEAQAKWKKFGEEMQKKMNSPEAQAKWKKMGEDMNKEFGSPEAQAKWKKMGEDMAAKMNTPEFRAQIENIRAHALKSGDIARLSGLSRLHADSLFKTKGYQLSPDGIIFNNNDNSNSNVRQTEEYKKLKEKFDNEVKELKEKMEKKEKKEKVEGGNKSSQVTPAVMLYNNQDFTSAVKALNTLNAVVTYKKSDFTNANQTAIKSYVQAANLKITDDNAISISIK
ncbi:M56 family metallopeptidase [Pedobacter sp. ISL-68]|uniref:M56 family metallopeptidase n=1 Tax=unclassified Pedobacter TaxID=2628915 RepID=UPI001BE9FFD3|nr:MULTISPECIES: M56 family metallopeptidase [unclassified Pedobacter]MBT2563556.1 M56 family metallopeptidase [Pedobacter sp. ISL-64]MBT2592823.1 M56 family metallopeptidase [Pedobacter sp. ISL-68]